MRRRACWLALLVTLLAACALPRLARAEAPTEECVWRVTLHAAPEDDIDDTLWSGAASVEARACFVLGVHIAATRAARTRTAAALRALRGRRSLFACFACGCGCVLCPAQC
jgi:hypothetical protein